MTQAAQLAQYGSNNVGLSFKNRIINGDMVIAQRTAGAVTNVATSRGAGFALDRWSVWLANWVGGAATQQQSTDVPSGQGFVNSLLVTVTGASSTTDTSGRFLINQMIEGFNTADLNWGTANAKTVTFSFWVKSSVTGNYGFTLTNSGGDRAYVVSYAINSANTWEKKTVTIPGDTSGTWTTNNTAGITLNYDLGVNGPTTDTVNTWLAGDFRGLTSGVNLINTLGATFYLTGVQLEVGSVATSFDYLPYGTELMLCQRYYTQWGFNSGSFSAQAMACLNTSNASCRIPFPATMRTAPSCAVVGTINTAYQVYFNGAYRTLASASVSGDTTTDSLRLDAVTSGLYSGGGAALFYIQTTSGGITASAEL